MDDHNTLLKRHFIRGGRLDTHSNVPSTRPETRATTRSSISGPEARAFYESLVQSGHEEESLNCCDRNQACSVCGSELSVNSDPTQHLSSVAHQVAELSSKPIRPSPLVIPPSNVGYRLLRRMGWSDLAFSEDENDQVIIGDHLKNPAPSQLTTESVLPTGGLGSKGQGRRYPISTILKRDRLGLGCSSTKKSAKVTHFPARDISAIDTVRRKSGSASRPIKLDRQLQASNVKRDKARERMIRDQLNLSDEQMSILYGHKL